MGSAPSFSGRLDHGFRRRKHSFSVNKAYIEGVIWLGYGDNL